MTEAIQLVDTKILDVLLLDVEPPVMSGYEVVRQIREKPM
jgi:CheY-like chemotaxis protein